MRSWFSPASLAARCARRPWRVLLTWGVLLLGGMAFGSTINDVVTGDWRFTNKPESVRADELLETRLGQPRPVVETLLVRAEDPAVTVEHDAFRAAVGQIVADLTAMPEIVESVTDYYAVRSVAPEQAEALVSADRRTLLVPVAVTTSDSSRPEAQALLDRIPSFAGNGFEVMTVGDLSIWETNNVIAEEDLRTGEMRAVPVALLILIVVCGSLVAAGLPLALALVAIMVATGLAAVIGRVYELSFYVINMMTMIGLAVGIDYALFVVERFREERRAGRDRIAAVEQTGDTAGRAVLFSGVTVVLALLGIFTIRTTIFSSLAMGAILAVLVAVAATLTLIPALLALLGDRIDWPRRRRGPRQGQPVTRPAGPIVRFVLARPLPSALIASGGLLLLSLPVFDLDTGMAWLDTFPESEVKSAYETLARDFPAGVLSPVQVVVDVPRSPAVEADLDELADAIAADPAFAGVQGIVWNASEDLAVLTAPLATEPGAVASFAAVERLREELIPAAFGGGSAEVLVTGNTAFMSDFFILTDRATLPVFAFVLGLSFVLLTLVFRSIVVPLKAIVMNLLSVGAAYGLLVLVFQKGVGADLFGFIQTPAIDAWIPIFLFCVLFGLSMDYHVFLLSRVREAYDRSQDNRASIATGLGATARIITGAALIMVVVFSGFAGGRLVMFQQMGFGLAVAILLDATIVRSVLVPATMALLGDRNWYLPRWLAWLPDLRVESGPRKEPAADAALLPAPAGD